MTLCSDMFTGVLASNLFGIKFLSWCRKDIKKYTCTFYTDIYLFDGHFLALKEIGGKKLKAVLEETHYHQLVADRTLHVGSQQKPTWAAGLRSHIDHIGETLAQCIYSFVTSPRSPTQPYKQRQNLAQHPTVSNPSEVNSVHVQVYHQPAPVL